MAKKKTPKKKKREKVDEIDHIPKFWQQPRSSGGPRPRKDFSFFCFSSSKGLLLESLRCKESLISLEDKMDKREENFELPVIQCDDFLDETLGLFSNFIEVPIIEVESVAQNAPFEGLSARNLGKQKSDIIGKLKFAPDKSQITERGNSCVTTGSVVWAKTAQQQWWPAEILGENSTIVDSNDHDVDGQVLVQYYGNYETAWVDPTRDLSRFDDCFEERSCNPVEEFQDALKQALHQRESQSVGKEFIGSSDDPGCSNQQGQSPDKWNSSSSSRTESNCLEMRRGKRERKPKVRFDDVTFPLKPVKKVRRLRIMRFLGLAAPIGSPFSLTM